MDLPQHEKTPLLKWHGPWAPTGWLLLALGGSGLVGWVLAIPLLVQPFLGRAPIRPLAVPGLIALGIGALALDRRRHRLAIVAAVLAMAVGYLGLLQLTTGLDLGLERLALRPALPLRLLPSTSLTLPVASAIGFLVGGGALALIAGRLQAATAAAFAVGLAGAGLVALNLALLVGQVLGLSQGVQFGRLAGSSPQVAVGMFALGLALASWAWSRDWSPTTYPAWVPVVVGMASLGAVLLIWRALVQGQRDDQKALVSAVARGSEDRILEAMSRTNTTLWRVAWLSQRGVVGSERWMAQVKGVMSSTPGLTHVAWAAEGGNRLIMVPPSADSAALRLQLAMQLRPTVPASLDSVRHFSLGDSTPTVAVAIPRCDLTQCEGYVVGLIRVDQMLLPVADSLDGFHRSVSWRGARLFGPAVSPDDREGSYRSVLVFDDMTWELAVWPTEALRGRMVTRIPDLILALGLLVTALLPVALQLSRTLKANARTAEQVRLRLALGRSMDRAWSWDLSRGNSDAGSLSSSAAGQELRRGQWTQLIHPDDRRRVETLLMAHLEGRATVFEAQYRLRGSAGAWDWRVDRGHVAERAADGTALQMLGVSGDVSERVRIDEERASSERRFRAIFDSAYQIESLLDLEGRVLEANPTVLKLSGPDARIEELQGLSFWEAKWWPTPQVRERIKAAVTLAGQGETITDEVEARNAAGDRLLLDFSLKPIRDATGNVVQLLAEGRDVTAGRRAEAQLREVETLSTMGRLAARVAHEINNPLAGIQNSFLLLRDAIPTDHPHYAYVGAMEREIGRIAGVTRQLYETYRPEASGSGRSGVRTLIGDAVAFLEQLNRPSKVRILAELDSVPSQVAIPESVLRQSVYNLVQNAVEASPPGGTVTVQANITETMFVLRVRDEGPGVPAELRSRIFQPFVSAKDRNPATSGMGIGLSMVHRSVKALGGTVEIADPPGGGAEFVVRIPLSPAQGAQA